jgi:hypothetical protein
MKVSKTAIFLFELMVVILIFSIAAAVCTSAFGKAYGFSEDSKGLTMAVLKAESIAEEFKAGKVKTFDDVYASFGMDEDMIGEYKQEIGSHEQDSVSVFFDADWNVTQYVGPLAKNVIMVIFSKEGELSVMDISVGVPDRGHSYRGLGYNPSGVFDEEDPPGVETASDGSRTYYATNGAFDESISDVVETVVFNDIYDLQVKSYGK